MAGKYSQATVRALLPEDGSLISTSILAQLGKMSESQMTRLLEAMLKKGTVVVKHEVTGVYWGLLTEQMQKQIEKLEEKQFRLERRGFESHTEPIPAAAKLRKRKCFNCNETILEPGRYIYPLPERFSASPFEGGMACAKCAPDLEEEVRAMGHLEKVSER